MPAPNSLPIRIAIDAHRVSHETGTSGHKYLALMIPIWNNDPRFDDINLLIPRTTDCSRNIPEHLASLSKVRVIQDERITNPLGKWERQFFYQQYTIPKLLRRTNSNLYFSPFHMPPLVTGDIPVVTTIHDLCVLEQPVRMLGMLKHREIHRLQLQMAIRKSKLLIAVSEYTADQLRVYNPDCSDRIRVVPNGLEFSGTLSGSAPRFNLQDPYLLWIGSPSYRKNPELAFEVLSMLRHKFPTVRLVCVVPRTCRDAMNATANQFNVADCITYQSSISNEQLDALYSGAALCLVTSRCEGFGYPILEAMAKGCPVVSWKHSPAFEIIDTVFELPEKLTAEDFSACAEQILNMRPEQREHLRLRLLTRASIFSSSSCAANSARVFHSAINAR